MVERVSWDVQSFIPAKHEMVLRNILYVGFVKAGGLSGCDSRPANWSLQPVAIGAIEEVTNRLRPRFKVNV